MIEKIDVQKLEREGFLVDYIRALVVATNNIIDHLNEEEERKDRKEAHESVYKETQQTQHLTIATTTT